MPYITSSIIMQLLTVVIPKLEQWQDQGEAGSKKITQWTRYVTVALALLQSTGLVFLFHNGQQQHPGPVPGARIVQAAATSLLIVLTLTAGTALIMWLGELITQRGIGNGMSILIFTQRHQSRLPFEGSAILRGGRLRQVHRRPADRHRRSSSPSSSWSRASGASRPVRQTGRRAASMTMGG